MTKIHLLPLGPEHRTPVIEIYNHAIAHSFAAYPDQPVGYERYDQFVLMSVNAASAAVRDESENVIGFGLLHPCLPYSTFARTLEITYFIRPEYTRQGIGGILLAFFVQAARALGADNLLASISSRNEQSLQFHHTHGFRECGRLEAVG